MVDKMLTVQDFEDKVNSVFTLDLDGDGEPDIQFTLIECEATSVFDFDGRKRDPFKLLFEAPKSTPLSQQILKLNHPVMGIVELFVVPVAQTETSLQYEAVFT